MKKLVSKIAFTILVFCTSSILASNERINLSDPPSAILTTTNTSRIIDDVLHPFINLSWAVFSDNGFANSIFVDSVNINGFGLTNYNNVYLDSTLELHESPITWQVLGSNGMPSFNYINTNLMPVYNGYDVIPDQITPNQSFSFPLLRIDHADKITVQLKNVDSNIEVTKEFGNNETAYFDPNEVNSLVSPNSSIVVYILLGNIQEEVIDGKVIAFVNQTVVQKELQPSN